MNTMTLEEAWEILGVGAGTDNKAVRRAYLRLLKTHKPETDPVGFQRLRAAFERARHGPMPRTFVEAPAERAVEAHELLGADSASLAVDPSPEPAAFPAFDPPEPEPWPFAIFEERIADLDPYDAEEEIAILEDAIASLPDEPEGYWRLHELYLDRQDYPRSKEALERGVAQGLADLAVTLLQSYPGALDREQLELFEDRLPWHVLASAWTALDEPDKAVALADAVIAEERWLELEQGEVHRALETALFLMSDGWHREGRELGHRALRAASEAGLGLRRGGQGDHQWALSRELLGLEVPLTADLEALLATSILSGQPPYAAYVVLDEAERKQAKAIRREMKARAPALYEFASLEGRPEPPPRLKVGGGAPWAIVFGVFIAIKVFSFIDSANDPDPAQVFERWQATQGRRVETPSAPAAVHEYEGQPLEHVVNIMIAVREYCADAPPADCERARALVVAWNDEGCPGIRERLGSRQDPWGQPEAGDAGLATALPESLSNVLTRCAEPEASAGPGEEATP